MECPVCHVPLPAAAPGAQVDCPNCLQRVRLGPRPEPQSPLTIEPIADRRPEKTHRRHQHSWGLAAVALLLLIGSPMTCILESANSQSAVAAARLNYGIRPSAEVREQIARLEDSRDRTTRACVSWFLVGLCLVGLDAALECLMRTIERAGGKR